MYAIIESGGKQHKVAAGDTIKVELLKAGNGEEVSFKPLLVADGDKVWTAAEVKDFTVQAKVLGEGKRKKVLVFHKKRRKQYKKLYGHRQPYTELEILTIAQG